MSASVTRTDAVTAATSFKPSTTVDYKEVSAESIYGSNVFGLTAMKAVLPKDVFKSVQRTIDRGDTLDPSVADVVASAMKTWALGKGASLLLMGLWVAGSTLYRVFVVGVPEAEVMGIVGILALAANVGSVLILMRYKDGDAWIDRSFQEVFEIVKPLALGLVALGVEKGDRVSILGNTRPEWTYFDYAALSIGATVVPIYQTNSPEECAYVLENSDAKIVIVENDEQLAKIREVRAGLPQLQQVVMMIGDAVEGWDLAKAVPMTWERDGVFTATTTFNNGKIFRFFTKADWSAGTINSDSFAGSIDPKLQAANDGDKNLKFVGTTGSYKITADLNAGTIVME